MKNRPQQPLNDALFGRREIAAFHAGVKATVATKHIVYNEKYQIGVKNEKRGTAQRLGCNQIQVGWNDQIANEFAVFLNPDRPNRYFRGSMHVVE